MTLFEAKEYDPGPQRRKLQWMAAGLVLLAIAGLLSYFFWNWPQERRVDKFFSQLEHQNFEDAYSIWTADPEWKKHPERFKDYNFGRFQLDWGPGGEWGAIRSHHIDGSRSTKGSGVVVVVTVNDRSEKARIWVEKKDGTLSFSPY